MKNKVLKWEIAGIIFTILLGTLLHFVYEWSGYLTAAAVIAPINESIWEHTKMGFYPALIFAVIEYIFIGKSLNNFFTAKAASLILIPVMIIALNYGYTSILGHNLLAVDITNFVITIIVAFILSYKILTAKKLPVYFYYLSFALILVLIAAFSVLTFSPPHIDLFIDPRNGGFGI